MSERLSEQVLHALYEFVRGLQAAHDASGGDLLSEPLSADGDRNDIYRGLLSVILRLVFLLYTEERGVLPDGETFVRHYSLAGLYRRLREDAALHPDTMDQRFGAWVQLLVLFRLIHDGARAHRTGGAVSLPERRGALFDPDRYPFLEGRHAGAGARQRVERVRPPLVSDGTVYRVLEKLLVLDGERISYRTLDGERISYRTLDVEQIGSVYETIMGFRMEIATGPSVAIRPAKRLGAPRTIDLGALLAQPKGGRARWLQAQADRNVTESVAKGLRAAETVDDLHAALDRVLDKDATPDIVPPGALVLQPNEERRRSGSHYTPRELTDPIVRHALAPILDRLRGEDGRAPAPSQILDLKVCDPAMGSGAFIAGRIQSATRCSPVSLPSTPNGPPRKPARGRHFTRLEGKSSRGPHAHNTVECRQTGPVSGSRNQDPSGLPPMNELSSGLELTAKKGDLGRCRNLLACGVSSTPGKVCPRVNPPLAETPMEARIANLKLIQDMVSRLASDSFRTRGWTVDSPPRVGLGRVVTFTDVQHLDAVPNSPDDGSTIRGCALVRMCRSRP